MLVCVTGGVVLLLGERTTLFAPTLVAGCPRAIEVEYMRLNMTAFTPLL